MTDFISKAELERLSTPSPPLRSPAEQAEVDRIIGALQLAAQIVAASGRPHTTEEAMRVFEAVREQASQVKLPPSSQIAKSQDEAKHNNRE